MPNIEKRTVFITGGTGYVGRRLIPRLLDRGHNVMALTRPGSEGKAVPGCQVVQGNPLDGADFAPKVPPADTFVQLVGVPHPSPAKAEQFKRVDLVSIRASVPAAAAAGVRHFVYVSVAMPAPMMAAYLAVRAEGEALLRTSGLNATILRPWYILGPGHRWPYFLLPFYWLAERWPSTRDAAGRLGLITLCQMLHGLVQAVEDTPAGVRVWEVPKIREIARERSDNP